jgi:hypothetical protein
MHEVAQEQQAVLKTYVRGHDRGYEAGDSAGFQRCDAQHKAKTKLRLERAAAQRAQLIEPAAAAIADSADPSAQDSLVEPAVTSSKERRLRLRDALATLAALPRPVHPPPKLAPGASRGQKRRRASISKALSS